jgi:hypothetical protein
MGRPSFITQELVSKTAERLLAEGKPHSLVAVQKELGGSFSTVNKYYQKWRDLRVPADTVTPGSAPPEGLSVAFEAALSKRCAEVQSRYAEELNDKQSELEFLREALASLELEKAELERESGEAKEKAMIVMGENGALRDRLASLELEKAELLKRDDEFRGKCPAADDIGQAMIDGLDSIKPALLSAVQDAVVSSFQDLVGKCNLSGKPKSPKPAGPRPVKGASGPVKASSKKPGGSSGS